MINLYKGDCLEVMAGLPDDSVDLVLTDPPYDFKNTNAGGATPLSIRFQKTQDQLVKSSIVSGFDKLILDQVVRICKGVNAYFFCNKSQLPMYFDYFINGLGCSFDLIKWVKTNSPPTFNNKYLSDTEYCFYARKRGYCNPSSYSDASTLYTSPLNMKDKNLYSHPTIKPLPLVERLVRNSSKEGMTVLDCFMGSGTTGVACVNTNRKFIGIEQDDKYFEIAKTRIEKAQSENTQLELIGESE